MGVFHLGLAGPDNVAANPLPHPKFQHLNAHNIIDRDNGPRHRGTQLHRYSAVFFAGARRTGAFSGSAPTFS